MTRIRLIFFAQIALYLALVPALPHGASPVFWLVSTQDDFLRGETQNISVDATGQILLGPSIELIYDTTEPFIWSLATDGDAVWVGSGPKGAVTRIARDDGEVTSFDLDTLSVYALATDRQGGVFAATGPDGKVFGIDTDRNVRVVFDPDEPYIWSLATDASGTLYVGTGNPGRVYGVTPEGNAELFYETSAVHVRSLVATEGGRILAGTTTPGHVIRIEPDGAGFVLLDSGYEEIADLHIAANGAVLVVAANNSTSSVTVPTTAAASTGSTTAASAPSITTSTAATGNGTKGAVYEIQPDGIWNLVWDSNIDTPYAVLDDNETARGAVIATGPDGKVFRITADNSSATLLTSTRAQQITTLIPDVNGSFYLATANPGLVVRLDSDRAREGTYLSEIHDTGTLATWGTLTWQSNTPGDSAIELFTRTGNTQKPSDTWSNWSAATDTPRGAQIDNPKARYLQWKAVLTGRSDTPLLHSVTTAYLPRNLAPEVTEITTHAPGQVFQQALAGGDPPIAGLDVERGLPSTARGSSSPEMPATTLGRQVYRKGLRTFVWKARDLNGDQIQFEVLYRSDDAASTAPWTPLKQETNRTIYTWDTTSVPDGVYSVLIVASDLLANTPNDFLTGDRNTGPLVIDNSPPQITVPPASRENETITLEFTVSDTHSPVERVEYSTDTEQWQLIYPNDGISDSTEELFSVTVDADDFSRMVIRATDAMDNTATTGTSFEP